MAGRTTLLIAHRRSTLGPRRPDRRPGRRPARRRRHPRGTGGALPALPAAADRPGRAGRTASTPASAGRPPSRGPAAPRSTAATVEPRSTPGGGRRRRHARAVAASRAAAGAPATVVSDVRRGRGRVPVRGPRPGMAGALAGMPRHPRTARPGRRAAAGHRHPGRRRGAGPRPERAYGLRRLLRGFGCARCCSACCWSPSTRSACCAAGADPARHRPGRHAASLGAVWAASVLAPGRRPRPVGRADRGRPG